MGLKTSRNCMTDIVRKYMAKARSFCISQNESDFTSRREVITEAQEIITVKTNVIFTLFLKLLTSKKKDLSIFSQTIYVFRSCISKSGGGI